MSGVRGWLEDESGGHFCELPQKQQGWATRVPLSVCRGLPLFSEFSSLRDLEESFWAREWVEPVFHMDPPPLPFPRTEPPKAPPLLEAAEISLLVKLQ